MSPNIKDLSYTSARLKKYVETRLLCSGWLEGGSSEKKLVDIHNWYWKNVEFITKKSTLETKFCLFFKIFCLCDLNGLFEFWQWSIHLPVSTNQKSFAELRHTQNMFSQYFCWQCTECKSKYIMIISININHLILKFWILFWQKKNCFSS